MAISRVRLTFTDDNHGANEADGYKIYRKVGSDPCPGGVIDPSNLHETVAGITTGSEVQWTDMTADPSTNYFYRASFYRGSDESLSQMAVGPIVFPSADDLGYPNNSPAHDSGVQNFMSVEPIYHLAADKMHSRYGVGPLNNGMDNEANSYDQFRAKAKIYASEEEHIKMWDKGGTMAAIPVMEMDDDAFTSWASRASSHFSGNQVIDRGVCATSSGGCNIGVFDQGYTFISVFKGRESYGTAYLPSNSGDWMSNYSAQTDMYSRLQSHWTFSNSVNMSDGQPWTHPAMPAWQSDPSNHHDYSNSWFTGTAAISLTRQSHYLLFDYSGTRTAEIPDSYNRSDLILKVDHVDPDGSHRIFYNGTLAADWQGTPILSATANLDTAVGYVPVDFKAYPMYDFTNNQNIHDSTPLRGQCMRVEQLLTRTKLSNEDLLRVVAYLNDKYDGYLATQSNYAGL